ncbi:hypothetical protein Hanom_Chr01g00019101 [Helianthus anomalus]
MIFIILCYSDHFLGNWRLLISVFLLYSLTCCVGLLFVFEPRVSPEAASLSLGIGARPVYIPPSPDPIRSSAICGIYWVWLLLLLLLLCLQTLAHYVLYP